MLDFFFRVSLRNVSEMLQADSFSTPRRLKGKKRGSMDMAAVGFCFLLTMKAWWCCASFGG